VLAAALVVEAARAWCAAGSATAAVRVTELAAIGPPGGGGYAVAVDARHPGTIFLGSTDQGLYKSADAGATWSSSNAGLGDAYVLGLAFDPGDSRVVYAATARGIFKSLDEGSTWTPTGNRGAAAALVVAPGDPPVLYAGHASGVGRSLNGGVSWSFSPMGYVYALAVDPSSPGTVYAATEGGLLRTMDGGDTWSPGNLSGNVTAVVIDPLAPSTSTVYASVFSVAVFKSADGGETWSAHTAGLTDRNILALGLDPSAPSRLYAAARSDGPVYRSLDAGVTWAATDLRGVRQLAVDPGTGVVYAVGDGFHRSADQGATWDALPLSLQYVDVLEVDPQSPATLYVGIGRRLFRSDDAGAHWDEVPTGEQAPITAVAIDPSSSLRVFAGLGSFNFDDPFTGGLIRSEDRGMTWSRLLDFGREAGVGAIAVHPEDPDTFLVGIGGGFSGAVFKTTDGGLSWADTTGPIIGNPGWVTSIAIDPRDPSTAYASTPGGGTFRSSTGGDSWEVAEPFAGGRVVVDPLTSVVYLAGSWRSSDGGRTWRELASPPFSACSGLIGTSFALARFGLPAPLPPVLIVGATCYDPRRYDVVVSGDDGGSWELLASADVPLQTLAARDDPAELYIATAGAGVYRAGLRLEPDTTTTTVVSSTTSTSAIGSTPTTAPPTTSTTAAAPGTTTTTLPSLATSLARLADALPDVRAAHSMRERRVAQALGRLYRRARRRAERCGETRGRNACERARTVLARIASKARKADGHGRLGVPLAPIEEAVARVLSLLPGPRLPPP
jgi:photosystem II stability/assembly factor-like uncharacterized protein